MNFSPRIQQFLTIYQTLKSNNVAKIGQVYDLKVRFRDPLHQISGLDKLEQYFAGIYENVDSCEFEIDQVFEIEQYSFLYWTMRLRHERLARGREIVVKGHTQLVYQTEKVIEHNDYFDLGEMVYEQLPILGWAIKQVKSKVAS